MSAIDMVNGSSFCCVQIVWRGSRSDMSCFPEDLSEPRFKACNARSNGAARQTGDLRDRKSALAFEIESDDLPVRRPQRADHAIQSVDRVTFLEITPEIDGSG